MPNPNAMGGLKSVMKVNEGKKGKKDKKGGKKSFLDFYRKK